MNTRAKIVSTCAKGLASISDGELRQVMNELLAKAVDEIKTGN